MKDKRQTGMPVNLITCLFVMVLIFTGTVSAEPVTVKVAMITPEGSTWTNMLHQMAQEVTKKSGGDVNFKIYPGGISGDELDVIRKMRAGRIHAAGFSGVGLGVLAPKIRILEAPLLYENEGEIDRIKEKLFGEFAEQLDRNGYVLLGFAEAGFVYIFSKTDISGPGWLERTRMWAWKGDPVAGTFLSILGITTHPLHLTDVNTGLETGMIDSFYSPPLGAVAFQWHAKIRFALDYPVVNSTGALIIKKDIFNRLSPENQTLLKTTARVWCDRLIEATREDNREAVAVMKESGITFVLPTAAQERLLKQSAEESRRKNIPDLYSQDLLDRVEGLLSTCRETNATEKSNQ
jgi:TRAP-type transport system periplasmic protein